MPVKFMNECELMNESSLEIFDINFKPDTVRVRIVTHWTKALI